MHLDVQKDDSEVVFRQSEKRLFAGGRPDEVLAQIGQDRFQGQQVCRQVIHEEDIRFTKGRLPFRCRVRFQGFSPMRIRG
jgi:hypothetical protein